MKRLAIVTTHPIQYNAPLFMQLTKNGKVQVKVFYTWPQAAHAKFDPGFGQIVKWDLPLLEGYDFCMVENTSVNPGSSSFSGIKNPTLISEIENWKPDAILVYGWNFNSHLRCIFHFKGKIKILFRGDSTLLDQSFGIKSFLRKIILNLVFKFIDKALYVGTENKKYFRWAGVDERKLHYVPHIIDNSKFDVTGRSNERNTIFRTKIGIDENTVVIGFAGKFENKKSPLLLIRAIMELKNKDIKLLLAGNGNLNNEILTLSKHDDRIIVLPFQNQTEMPYFYAACNIFCLPSSGPNETWGLAINEAMVAGCAIVASNKVGCAIDLIENERNGFIFNAGDVHDLKNKLINLMANKDNLNRMGLQSKLIISKYTIEKAASDIEQCILML